MVQLIASQFLHIRSGELWMNIGNIARHIVTTKYSGLPCSVFVNSSRIECLSGFQSKVELSGCMQQIKH